MEEDRVKGGRDGVILEVFGAAFGVGLVNPNLGTLPHCDEAPTVVVQEASSIPAHQPVLLIVKTVLVP